MKKLLLLAALSLSAISSKSGIYRHDVDKARYTGLAQLPDFDCVGELLTKDGSSDASCVLISEKYVLTAAHLVLNKEKKAEEKQVNGMTVTFYSTAKSTPSAPEDITCRFKGRIYTIKKITIEPHYLDAATKGSCDIAILELTERVEGIRPALLNINDELALHKKVVGVGYGVSGKANDLEDVLRRREKIAGENIIDSVGGYRMDGTPTHLIADLDHPENKELSKMGSPIPCDLEYTVAGGDSGGGLFCQVGDEWRLVGICAGTTTDIQALLKTGYYGQTMWWTNITPFLKWITENRYLK